MVHPTCAVDPKMVYAGWGSFDVVDLAVVMLGRMIFAAQRRVKVVVAWSRGKLLHYCHWEFPPSPPATPRLFSPHKDPSWPLTMTFYLHSKSSVRNTPVPDQTDATLMPLPPPPTPKPQKSSYPTSPMQNHRCQSFHGQHRHTLTRPSDDEDTPLMPISKTVPSGSSCMSSLPIMWKPTLQFSPHHQNMTDTSSLPLALKQTITFTPNPGHNLRPWN